MRTSDALASAAPPIGHGRRRAIAQGRQLRDGLAERGPKGSDPQAWLFAPAASHA